jgi:hypothetical protein
MLGSKQLCHGVRTDPHELRLLSVSVRDGQRVLVRRGRFRHSAEGRVLRYPARALQHGLARVRGGTSPVNRRTMLRALRPHRLVRVRRRCRLPGREPIHVSSVEPALRAVRELVETLVLPFFRVTAVTRSIRWLQVIAAMVGFGCGGRTADFGTALDDGGLGGTGAVGGTIGAGGGSAGYTGYGGSLGGYVGAGGAPPLCEGEPVCAPVQCGPGQQEVTHGGCCPFCEPCPPVPCPLLDCGPGGQITTEPGQCCPVCALVDPCAGVRCGLPMCPPGSTIVSVPGQCCPVCAAPAVDASLGSCDQNGYAELVQKEILSLDALSCMIDPECTVITLVNSCELNCGRAVNVRSSSSLYNAAQQFANANCTDCPPTGGPTCPAAFVTKCVSGQCQLVLTLPPGAP